MSLNNSSIVSFCCFTKISRLEPRLKFKVRGREIGRARQTFQSGTKPMINSASSQIGKFAECAGDLSYVQIACAAVFVSLNNSSIVSFCCFTKISRLEPRLKFKVRGREIGRARQTFQSGTKPMINSASSQIGKFAECAGDLSYVQIACAAVFVSLNNSSIVFFCCFTKISRLEPWLKFNLKCAAEKSAAQGKLSNLGL